MPQVFVGLCVFFCVCFLKKSLLTSQNEVNSKNEKFSWILHINALGRWSCFKGGGGGGLSILISSPCPNFFQIPASSPDFALDNIPNV